MKILIEPGDVIQMRHGKGRPTLGIITSITKKHLVINYKYLAIEIQIDKNIFQERVKSGKWILTGENCTEMEK